MKNKTTTYAEIFAVMILAITVLCLILGKVEPSLKTIEVGVLITLIAVILKD